LAKQPRPSRKQHRRITAGEIISLLQHHASSMQWSQIVQAVGAESPRAITQLRQMLRGLQRTGELVKDHQGAFHLHQQQPASRGLIERSGRGFSVDGLSVEFAADKAKRLPIRVADEVEYKVVDGVARILTILQFSTAPLVGILNWQGKYPYVESVGSQRLRVSLAEEPQSADHGDTVQVKVLQQDSRGLVGVVVEVMDHVSVLDQAIETAVASGQIPWQWPEEVDQAVGRLPKSVQTGRFAKRRDLTQSPLVTIDGETAKDFDDAVFAETLQGKVKGKKAGWRLVVAIADVGHYVKPGSALDTEALQRGTSVYFPERVIPMLPEAISNELCSLKPRTPRLTLVCDMRIDGNGQVTRHEFYEAVIYSHARLTYTQVQKFLDGKKLAGVNERGEVSRAAIEESISALAEIYQVLRKAREKRGALDFATREATLVLRQGCVHNIQPVQRQDAHQLIEEAMIAANVCAALFLEDHDQGALYRVHEPPDAAKLEELRQALSYAGVRLAPGVAEPAALQAALSQLPDHANHWLYAQLALRSLKQAVYTPNNQGHFGLALQRYMHFTSPIRRYPDLVVHRAIKGVLSKQANPGKKVNLPGADDLQALGEQCSNNERRAESAGWLVDAWLKCDYLQDQVGQTLQGTIAAVTEFGLFVELEGYFIQGLLHISNLGSDYYQFHQRSLALVGERSGRRFSMGDTLEVIIQEIDAPQGKIDLLLAGNKGRTARGRKAKKQGRNRK